MVDRVRTGPSTSSAFVLIAAAGLQLGLGLLVYLADRGSSHVALLRWLPLAGGHAVFGVLGQWLPSFVHACAFGLLTAAALPAVPALRLGACAVWGAADVAFELGQHPILSPWLASTLHHAFGTGPLTRALSNYFVHGTFDIGDVAAAVLGALAASLLVMLLRSMEDRHAAQ
jgi:hypothetical protein